ncbi:zinc finger protein 62-like [Ruditapes philippinarum]|uniref:zinc finger protein 62-like n=1 Tax=Ruditapes philippinarum TaxID=129788 RepID=UPI00295B0C7D|nr:zinc finger protein 62-like [Ruditapes philippinarum]
MKNDFFVLSFSLLCRKIFVNKNNIRIHNFDYFTADDVHPLRLIANNFSRKAKGKYDSLQKNCSRENRTLARREGYSMMSDDSKKKIECETCGKRFNVRSKLERHMVVHTGEKRYFCDICGKGFGFRESLGEHLKRMHTDGQNLSKHRKDKICSICFKNFKSTEKLKEHMASHTSGKTFKCDLCSKSFTYKTCLLRHHHESHSRKMFSCNICGKMFGIKPYLDEHMKFVHKLVKCVNNLEDNDDNKDDKDEGNNSNVGSYNDVANDNDGKVNDQIKEKSDMDLTFMDTVLNDAQEDSDVKKELKMNEIHR